ncbi:flagellar M-ring protein [Blastochloris tepida]|uniref:Flagellar M-ring protein n=2 Tax=Blastochloris tepida TaxID=2233851 RepID=A0A348G200_9HYPH|nr:flagellar basal-body MS-ring/collar protein FliF [Blastochloris tepida]BBF93583.1 flagellar M-ring protein [Blastochloris tepida]
MAAVTAALIGFFGFVIVRFSQPPMATLYNDLALQDSAAIVKDLERAGVAYELRGDGSTILVPKADVARLRMKMAEAGLPRGGSVGYEIFDKSDSLGTTSFVQNINQLRALEGELARTISAIERIQQARVHLVIPERALFSRDKQDPSASIALRVQGELDPGQIRAIRHLVASAVQGLKPERVSIVDEAGRLLADGAGDDTMTDLASDERTAAYERRIKKQIDEIVSSVVGHGRARVQVNAEFDFNRITQTSDSYDPESRVVRSTQTREETQVSSEGNGQVSVANEVPNPAAQGGAPQVRDQSKKSEETVNYEISRTTRTEVVEGGRIKRVSVAVVVDGAYSRDGAGNVTYTPRTNEELDRITALVRSAIGFDQKRGDQVEVVNLRFAEGPPPGLPADEGWLSQLKFGKEDIMQAAETGVFVFLTLIVLLMVVRPMVRRILAGDEDKAAAALPALEAAGQLPESESPPLSPKELEESETARRIAYAKIQGQLHAQSIAKVGELVDQNPQETVGIIRQWMQQDAKP